MRSPCPVHTLFTRTTRPRALIGAAWCPRGGGGPLRPAGPPPSGQVRSAGRGQRHRAAQSGRAAGAPKGRDGTVEAVRALMVAKRSAAGRAHPDDQPGQGAGPDRARRAEGPLHPAHPAALVAGLASPRRCRGYATCIALRELGRRADAAWPKAHEGFGSLRRPKASGQPRGRRPGTRAPRRALQPHARPRHTGACSCATRGDVAAQ